MVEALKLTLCFCSLFVVTLVVSVQFKKIIQQFFFIFTLDIVYIVIDQVQSEFICNLLVVHSYFYVFFPVPRGSSYADYTNIAVHDRQLQL